MAPPEEDSTGILLATATEASTPIAGLRRTKLSWAQLVRLESIFAQTWYPSWAEKDTLAREFDLEHQQINVWFCNRRTKAKREKEPMPDSFIPSHAQAALKSKRARPSEAPLDTSAASTTMTREPTPEPAPSSRASSTTPDPRPIALPPIRTSPPLAPGPAPVSASSAASIQAKLSSSLSAALLGSATSTAYRAPFVSQPVSQNRSRDRSLSPVPTRTHRHRSNSASSPRHSPYRQHTYPFTHQRSHSGSPPPAATLAPIGRPDYPHTLPPFHKAGPHPSFPAALPAPPTTKPHELYQRYPSDQVLSPHSPTDPEHRKALLAQQHIQAVPHVGALQAAPHVGAFHSMPVVGVFQGTAPPPAELPISVWQAHPLVRTRARITREQLRALEALFSKTWFPTSHQRAEAASATGMREYSVTVWFQNRRSKAKKEGISPPENDRAKLRKDKGPKRDLGTHVFEVGSSRHPEPMASGVPAYPTAPSGGGSHPPMAEHNLVWLEDARSRGRAPVMKAGGTHSPRITENMPERSRSPRSRSWSGAEPESDVEMESESESRASRPRYPPVDESRGRPPFPRAYSQYPPRESQAQTLYPPREVHPSYANANAGRPPPMRRQSSSSSCGGVTRRRNSGQSRSGTEEDAPEPVRPETEPGDRPAKRSRRENEHAPEDEHSDPE
ncbi:homeobox domain protein [Rhizoctonia solani 123E]|uniref:Homeobox domain protein n=1 Tax=Rhizoctonia solani 123E TaxID=1423351 RepID=A0A074SWV4_9AGAM|nr:homeobox domain protein [Rhizoctonia solani 123E]